MNLLVVSNVSHYMPFLDVDKVRTPGLIHSGPRFKHAFQAPQICPTLAAMSHIQHQQFPRYMLIFLQLVFHALMLTLLVHFCSEDPHAICMHQHILVCMCAIPRVPHFLVDQASKCHQQCLPRRRSRSGIVTSSSSYLNSLEVKAGMLGVQRFPGIGFSLCAVPTFSRIQGISNGGYKSSFQNVPEWRMRTGMILGMSTKTREAEV